jgi:hypothetical protein
VPPATVGAALPASRTAVTPSIESLIEDLRSCDWPTVREAKLALVPRAEAAILHLIELLDNGERVALMNTFDLDYPGASLSFGHGGSVPYDIDWLMVRAGWVLEEISFENFGFNEQVVRDHPLLAADRAEIARRIAASSANILLFDPYRGIGGHATRARIFLEAADRARAWWQRSSSAWSRFSAILTALRGDDTERQVKALSWLRGDRDGGRCEGLNKCTYDKLIRPIAEKLTKSRNPAIRAQAQHLLEGIDYRWSCNRCGYDLIGIHRGRCPDCGASVKRESY